MTQVIYDSAINATNCYTAVNRDQRKNINNKNLELEIMRKIEIYKFQRITQRNRYRNDNHENEHTYIILNHKSK